MTNTHRWIGTVLLVALLIWSKSGGGGLLPPVPTPGPVAEKLWIVATTDTPTRTPQQVAVLLNPEFWNASGHAYEHYEKTPGGAWEQFKPFSKFADEMFFQDATSGKVLGVVEIPAKPDTTWATSQIARFAK